jgi:sialate O-acetylesterase
LTIFVRPGIVSIKGINTGMINFKTYKTRLFLSAFITCFTLVFPVLLQADELEEVVNLRGNWKFSIGDDPEWAKPAFDDSNWDNINVPESWESNGYADYNGYAWYRKTFRVSALEPEKHYFLLAGYIDDVDEIYLNGKLIGKSGVMPPRVVTAHEMLRKYRIPEGLLKQGETNLIAVRVFDEYQRGGIYGGQVGIFFDREDELLAVNLAGMWKFEDYRTSDDDSVPPPNEIFVPGYWETQGYPDLDGSATYSREFFLPSGLDVDELNLVMGYIDDIDKVYINGVRIGAREYSENNYDEIMHLDVIFRAYEIPTGTLKPGAKNTIEVRVTDIGGLGGIYRGPVGLVTSYNFRRLKDNHKTKLNPFEQFWKGIFEWD